MKSTTVPTFPTETENAILHLAAVIRGRQGGLAKSRKKALAARKNARLPRKSSRAA